MESEIEKVFEGTIKKMTKTMGSRINKLESKFNQLKNDLYALTKDYKTYQTIANEENEESLSCLLEEQFKVLITEEREVRIII